MDARDLLDRQKNRSLARILSANDELVPASARPQLRKVVLEEVNDFCELAVCLLETVADETSILNEAWLDKLEEIHRAVAPRTQNVV